MALWVRALPQTAALCRVLTRRREEASCRGVSSRKCTVPTVGPTLMTSCHPDHLLKALLPNTIPLGLQLPREFGEHSSVHGTYLALNEQTIARLACTGMLSRCMSGAQRVRPQTCHLCTCRMVYACACRNEACSGLQCPYGSKCPSVGA